MPTNLKTALSLARKVRGRHLRGALTSPRFAAIQFTTQGMLSPRVYRRLYREAVALPDLPFVEVGAATGTATISLGLGYRDSGKTSPIGAVEKCEGGSRRLRGSFFDNLELLTSNLARYSVDDQVVLFTETLTPESGTKFLATLGPSHLAGFMHDADGDLARDFDLFWPATRPGGLIVVDDYAGDGNGTAVRTRKAQKGKQAVTTALLDVLARRGFFAFTEVVGYTAFGVKPDHGDPGPVPVEELTSLRLAVASQFAER